MRAVSLAGVLIVVLAALIALLAPMPVAALVPGTHPVNLTSNPADDAEPDWGAPAAQPTATTPATTTLTVFPTSVVEGFPVVFLTHVAPRGTAGAIQVMDGTTALGGPLPAAAGFALLITTLPTGTHTLTAVFTPTDPEVFASSTSVPVTLTVKPLFR